MFEKISSRDNEQVKNACRLASSGGFRREKGLFFAEGKRLCADLAQGTAPVQLFCAKQIAAEWEWLAAKAEQAYEVNDPVAHKLGGTQSSQGVFGVFRMPKTSPEDLEPGKGLLCCEAVQDPGNVGAVIRSAAAFGFGGVLLLEGSADPYAPKALRASAGTVVKLPVLTGVPLEQAETILAENKMNVLAAAAQPGALTPRQAADMGAFALLLGNEGAGLSARAAALAQHTVMIPMQRDVESLNAAVAASVLMYALQERNLQNH